MIPGQILRRATLEDLPAIQACARDAYAGYVARIGRDPAPMVADFASQINKGLIYIVVGALDAGANESNLLGYVVFYPRDDHLQLENVAVRPDYQGRGVGARLIGFVEDEARRGGYNAVELYTNALMTENLVMYPRIGFVEIARRHEDGFDRVYFRKAV